MEDTILQVKDLRTYFYTQDGEVRAVDGLSYDVRKNECVGLVGESACGKTVSALSIMRLIPYPPGIIVGGEVIFKGQDLLKLQESDMHKIRGNEIAMVFQEPMTSLNPVLTISLQLSESLKFHGMMDRKASAEHAVKLLKFVGIPDAERRVQDYPHQFSGGMQQRIMIAMALSCNPTLLICDEPTTSIDVTVQAQILEEINKLRTQLGTAVIIITYNLGVVARYVDRLNVMYAGRLVEAGPTDVIYARSMHPYTQGLLGSVPRLDLPRSRKINIIDGLPPNLAHLPKGCSFQPRCSYAIERCSEEKPVLEEIEHSHYAACFRSRELESETRAS